MSPNASTSRPRGPVRLLRLPHPEHLLVPRAIKSVLPYGLPSSALADEDQLEYTCGLAVSVGVYLLLSAMGTMDG